MSMQSRIPPLKGRRGYLCLSLMVSRKAWSVFSVEESSVLMGRRERRGINASDRLEKLFREWRNFLLE